MAGKYLKINCSKIKLIFNLVAYTIIKKKITIKSLLLIKCNWNNVLINICLTNLTLQLMSIINHFFSVFLSCSSVAFILVIHLVYFSNDLGSALAAPTSIMLIITVKPVSSTFEPTTSYVEKKRTTLFTS